MNRGCSCCPPPAFPGMAGGGGRWLMTSRVSTWPRQHHRTRQESPRSGSWSRKTTKCQQGSYKKSCARQYERLNKKRVSKTCVATMLFKQRKKLEEPDLKQLKNWNTFNNKTFMKKCDMINCDPKSCTLCCLIVTARLLLGPCWTYLSCWSIRTMFLHLFPSWLLFGWYFF